VTVEKSREISCSSASFALMRSPREKRKIPVPPSLWSIEPFRNKKEKIRRRDPNMKSPFVLIFVPKG
jgi:hypothetical protein